MLLSRMYSHKIVYNSVILSGKIYLFISGVSVHRFWTAWWKVHIFLFYLQLVCTKIMRENYLKWVYCEVSSWVPLLLWLTLKFNAKLYCQFRELSVIFWQVLLSDWYVVVAASQLASHRRCHSEPHMPCSVCGKLLRNKHKLRVRF